MIPLQVVQRECGDCTVCCTILGVNEIGKLPQETCEHVCADKCAIYENRPHSCREFECLWLSGAIPGDERRRPDNLGLMFVPNNDYQWMITVREIKPGAIDENRYLLDRIAKKFVMYCISTNIKERRRLFGPPHLMEAVKEVIKSKAGKL